MKCTEHTDHDGNSSFISDVFDFVSRELNQFVSNATGGAVAVESITPSRGQNRPWHNKSAPAAPSSHSIMPGALFQRSPTLEPDNLPELRVTAPTNLLLHDEYADGKDNGKSTASHRIYQNSVSHDDRPPSIAIASCALPTGVKSVEVNSTGQELSDEQPRSHGCIDITPQRPAIGGNSKRNDTPLEGLFGEQESNLQKMEETLRDKERIRHLEEEVRILKELLKKDHNRPILFPPAPPPPPPTRAVNTQIPIPSKISDPSLLISSARASLKRAPTPVEAPINPRMRTKRQGLPAVGVPPDKMAAFLSELKNVRLRKVGSSSKQALSVPNLATDGNIPSPFTLDFIDPNSVETGGKRKREFYDDGSNCISDKIHPMVSAVQFRRAACSAPSSSIDSITLHPWDSASANSRTFFATENTTPSLISDNDHERDDVSPDEHTPQTPPGAPSHIREPKEVTDKNVYIQYRDMSSAGELRGSPPYQAVSSQALSVADIFSRRVPTSPLPPNTPRKPYPPSKARRSPRNALAIGANNPPPPTNRTDARDSANQRPQEQIIGPPPKRDLREIATSRSFAHHPKKGRPRNQRKQINLHPLRGAHPRRTLDQELQHAVKSLESIGAEGLPDYEECDVFIGVGCREKSANCPPCDTTFHPQHNTYREQGKSNKSQNNPFQGIVLDES